MKRITKRQRLMIGGLGVVGLVWTVDALTRGGPPPARATPAPAAAAAPVQTPVAQDVNALVEQLTRVEYRSVATELDTLQRDLFLPTAIMQPAPLELSAAAEDPAREVPPPPEPDFASQHRLVGVLIGRSPVAVIDERLVPLNADLDGYTLIEVHRDYVAFRQREGGQLVTLTLAPRPEKP